jgi:DDE superfamily endonuclease/Tc5 transposase DNA-binding domain
MDQASRAVRLVDRGQFKSIRQVSKATGVARSTVQDRHAGRQPRGQEDVKHARLTRYQEEILAKYIQNTQLQYAPVNRQQLHVVAEMLAQLNEPNARLGKNWLSRFLDRHPDLKTARNRGLDSKRITAAIPSQIEGWFAHVDDVVRRFNIHPQDRWNMDEIGYQLSHSQNELVVFDRRTGAPLSLASGSTGWCSVLESISAIGDTMKPLVIHRGTAPDKPLDRWFPASSECPHWRWGFTEKGWTNNEHAIEWLKEVFIPQSRRGRDPDDASYWRLLIVDGHGSHTQGEFIFECLMNQVLVVYLLPHTSHLSQPCDLGPFGHLKSYYSKNLKSFITLGDTQITRARFNVLYHRTRQEGLTAQYILAGWRRSGLYPLDARKVLDKPEVARYRATTPDLAPPQSHLTLTPQDDYEYERIQETLNSKLTRSGRRLQKQLSHAYFRESSARKLLSFEVSKARKRTLEDEVQETTKRLRKQDDKRTWDTTEIFKARGYTAEETAGYIDVLPNRALIYNVEEEPNA